MKNSLWYIVLLGVLAGFLCSSCQEEKVFVKQDLFFSLDTFMMEEKERLEQFDRFLKVVSLDGRTDSTYLNLQKTRQELEIFANADINKASWLDKYKVDSITNESGSLQQLIYMSIDSSLNTRKLTVDYSGDKVSRIFIKRKSSSFISDKRETLVYEPEKGYQIDNHQGLIFSDDQHLRIEVSYLREKSDR